MVSEQQLCRWLLIGTYVGFATVGAFVAWYMYTNFLGIDLSQDGHSTVTWYQLTHWNQCSHWKGFQVRPRQSSLCTPFILNPTLVGVLCLLFG